MEYLVPRCLVTRTVERNPDKYALDIFKVHIVFTKYLDRWKCLEPGELNIYITADQQDLRIWLTHDFQRPKHLGGSEHLWGSMNSPSWTGSNVQLWQTWCKINFKLVSKSQDCSQNSCFTGTRLTHEWLVSASEQHVVIFFTQGITSLKCDTSNIRNETSVLSL